MDAKIEHYEDEYLKEHHDSALHAWHRVAGRAGIARKRLYQQLIKHIGVLHVGSVARDKVFKPEVADDKTWNKHHTEHNAALPRLFKAEKKHRKRYPYNALVTEVRDKHHNLIKNVGVSSANSNRKQIRFKNA